MCVQSCLKLCARSLRFIHQRGSVQSVYLHHCRWVKHPHFTDAEEKEGEKRTDSYGIPTTLIMLDGKYHRVFRAIMSDKYRRADTDTSSKHKKEGGKPDQSARASQLRILGQFGCS